MEVLKKETLVEASQPLLALERISFKVQICIKILLFLHIAGLMRFWSTCAFQYELIEPVTDMSFAVPCMEVPNLAHTSILGFVVTCPSLATGYS